MTLTIKSTVGALMLVASMSMISSCNYSGNKKSAETAETTSDYQQMNVMEQLVPGRSDEVLTELLDELIQNFHLEKVSDANIYCIDGNLDGDVVSDNNSIYITTAYKDAVTSESNGRSILSLDVLTHLKAIDHRRNHPNEKTDGSITGNDYEETLPDELLLRLRIESLADLAELPDYNMKKGIGAINKVFKPNKIKNEKVRI